MCANPPVVLYSTCLQRKEKKLLILQIDSSQKLSEVSQRWKWILQKKLLLFAIADSFSLLIFSLFLSVPSSLSFSLSLSSLFISFFSSFLLFFSFFSSFLFFPFYSSNFLPFLPLFAPFFLFVLLSFSPSLSPSLFLFILTQSPLNNSFQDFAHLNEKINVLLCFDFVSSKFLSFSRWSEETKTCNILASIIHSLSTIAGTRHYYKLRF